MPTRKKAKRKPYNKSTGRVYTGDSYDAKYSRKNSQNRSEQNKARRAKLASLTKKYGAAKAKAMMKGKDVAHVKPLRKGGTNSPSNLKLQSKSKNRGRAGEGNRRKGKRAMRKKRG